MRKLIGFLAVSLFFLFPVFAQQRGDTQRGGTPAQRGAAPRGGGGQRTSGAPVGGGHILHAAPHLVLRVRPNVRLLSRNAEALRQPNAHLMPRIEGALRQPNALLVARIAGTLGQRTAHPAILPSSLDIPMRPTWMPGPIAGSAMIPAGTMQITTSIVPGSTDIFQAPSVPPTSIVSAAAAANASALTASSSALPLPTTTTATTGFGIATTSWSMRTQTISAGI
jgi:hypothetical protein